MPAPVFINIKTSLGYIILNTDMISNIQRAKLPGGNMESNTSCVITLKNQLGPYSALVVNYSLEQLSSLLDAQIPR